MKRIKIIAQDSSGGWIGGEECGTAGESSAKPSDLIRLRPANLGNFLRLGSLYNFFITCARPQYQVELNLGYHYNPRVEHECLTYNDESQILFFFSQVLRASVSARYRGRRQQFFGVSQASARFLSFAKVALLRPAVAALWKPLLNAIYVT